MKVIMHLHGEPNCDIIHLASNKANNEPKGDLLMVPSVTDSWQGLIMAT